MFGVYGVPGGNYFVIGSETSNTTFQIRSALGVQPVNLAGGDLLFEVTNNSLSAPTIQAGSTETDILVRDGSGNIFYRNDLSLVGPQGPGGSGNYVISATAPIGPTSGDRWYDLTYGLEYVYINDGDSSQWISPAQAGAQGPTGPQGVQGSTGPGTLNNGVANQIAYYTATTTLSGTSSLTYDGVTLKLLATSGDEGGEIFLNKSVTNTSIETGVTIDIYQNKLRFFESGGGNRGGYIDITGLQAGVATNLAPYRYLYVTRITTTQTIPSGTWADRDIIFNNTVNSSGISYNTSTGVATLVPGTYRISAQLAWSAGAIYLIQFSCYTSANAQIGPTVEMIQPTSSSNNISSGHLDFIYVVSSQTDVKIRTTSTTNALSGEYIRTDLNTQMIIQQVG